MENLKKNKKTNNAETNNNRKNSSNELLDLGIETPLSVKDENFLDMDFENSQKKTSQAVNAYNNLNLPGVNDQKMKQNGENIDLLNDFQQDLLISRHKEVKYDHLLDANIIDDLNTVGQSTNIKKEEKKIDIQNNDPFDFIAF